MLPAMSFDLRKTVNGRAQRSTLFGPKPGAVTVHADTLVSLAGLCVVSVL